MPKRLLGRSRTSPLLATTSYPGPRYLLMVFALAGDSTITKLRFFFETARRALLGRHRAILPPFRVLYIVGASGSRIQILGDRRAVRPDRSRSANGRRHHYGSRG